MVKLNVFVCLLMVVDKRSLSYQFVRRGHAPGKVCTHQCCAGGTWYVILEEDEMEKTLGASTINNRPNQNVLGVSQKWQTADVPIETAHQGQVAERHVSLTARYSKFWWPCFSIISIFEQIFEEGYILQVTIDHIGHF